MSGSQECEVVGVVGEGTTAVERAVESAGRRVRTGEAAAVLDEGPDVVVTVGDHALSAYVATERSTTVPVLPIDAGRGVRSVPRSAADVAVGSLLAGDGDTHSYPIVAATVGGTERARALADLMLVTADPARISEYSVATGDTPVARFRADGVVVATPAGSHGYARTVGAPVVARDTGVAAVAPVAPFATDPDHWILPIESVELTVERDEAEVHLLADDRIVGTVTPGDAISVSRSGSLDVLAVPQSRRPFDRGD